MSHDIKTVSEGRILLAIAFFGLIGILFGWYIIMGVAWGVVPSAGRQVTRKIYLSEDPISFYGFFAFYAAAFAACCYFVVKGAQEIRRRNKDI